MPYSAAFARVYNTHWSDFARQVAPRIHDFYARITLEKRPILDLCCGTGQLALYFLERGYPVVGVDLSEPMLTHARQNAASFVETGQARFIQGDAADFTLEERFGLCVSTYDALNHLPDEAALRRCFDCVYRVIVEGGIFIFDLNTRLGLRRWNNINVVDTDALLLVNRGIYDGGERAHMSITGFSRDEDGRYSRFEEFASNTVYDLAAVHHGLLAAGWRDAHFARLSDLAAPVDEPENEGRIFVVAVK